MRAGPAGAPDGWTSFINLVNGHYPQPFSYNPIGDSVFPVSELTSLLAPNPITCGYGAKTLVHIDRPAMAEVNIQLTSDNPALVIVPATVTIPVGKMSASIDVQTSPIPIPFPPKVVAVHATYAGRRLTMTVEVVPPRVDSMTLSPDTVTAGDSSTGTISLDRPSLLGPVVIDLVSGAPGFATVPNQVTIPQNQLSAPFTIHTPPIQTPFSTAHATIVGTYSGSSVSALLTVKSRVVSGILHSLTLSPSTVSGGHFCQGIVSLEQPVPTDTRVGLAAMDLSIGPPGTGNPSSIASVPPSVTIRAGQTSASFDISTTSPMPGTRRLAQIIAAAVVAKYALLTVTA